MAAGELGTVSETLTVHGVVVPGWSPFAGAVRHYHSRQGIMSTAVFVCRGRWAGG
jgi:hypothetical protein